MNYKQLSKEKKAQIDILLEQGLSMRKAAEVLGISHSTISRYKANIYKKREINIKKNMISFYNICIHTMIVKLVLLKYVFISLKEVI